MFHFLRNQCSTSGIRVPLPGIEVPLPPKSVFHFLRNRRSSSSEIPTFLPGQPGELVDRAYEQRGRLLVQSLVHHVAWQRAAIAERTRPVTAQELELCRAGGVASVGQKTPFSGRDLR